MCNKSMVFIRLGTVRVKMDMQVDNMVSRASRRLFMLRFLKAFRLQIDDLVTVYTSYVSEFMKKNTLFRLVESWHAYPYSTCRQVKISFLGMPRLHIFKSKNEKAPYRGKGDTPLPHPPPAWSLRSLGLGRFAPSQRLCPPKMFWLITPLVPPMQLTTSFVRVLAAGVGIKRRDYDSNKIMIYTKVLFLKPLANKQLSYTYTRDRRDGLKLPPAMGIKYLAQRHNCRAGFRTWDLWYGTLWSPWSLCLLIRPSV